MTSIGVDFILPLYLYQQNHGGKAWCDARTS